MSESTLPERPHLNWLKNRAKEKLQQLRADEPQATLADARLAIAHEHGFPSWRALKAFVEAIRDSGEAIIQAVRRGDLPMIARILDQHPELVNATNDRENRILPSDTRAMRLIPTFVLSAF